MGDEREVFKTFTKNCIYNDGCIFTDILDIYDSKNILKLILEVLI